MPNKCSSPAYQIFRILPPYYLDIPFIRHCRVLTGLLVRYFYSRWKHGSDKISGWVGYFSKWVGYYPISDRYFKPWWQASEARQVCYSIQVFSFHPLYKPKNHLTVFHCTFHKKAYFCKNHRLLLKYRLNFYFWNYLQSNSCIFKQDLIYSGVSLRRTHHKAKTSIKRTLQQGTDGVLHNFSHVSLHKADNYKADIL